MATNPSLPDRDRVDTNPHNAKCVPAVRRVMRCAAWMLVNLSLLVVAPAQEVARDDLSKMNLEQLLAIQVTSVSKRNRRCPAPPRPFSSSLRSLAAALKGTGVLTVGEA